MTPPQSQKCNFFGMTNWYIPCNAFWSHFYLLGQRILSCAFPSLSYPYAVPSHLVQEELVQVFQLISIGDFPQEGCLPFLWCCFGFTDLNGAFPLGFACIFCVALLWKWAILMPGRNWRKNTDGFLCEMDAFQLETPLVGIGAKSYIQNSISVLHFSHSAKSRYTDGSKATWKLVKFIM